MRSRSLLLAAALPALLLAGCGKAAAPPDADVPHHHHHHAPHGGAAVELGDEEYHVELVLDAATGTLQAYVLDAELENFVRSSAPTLEIEATIAGAPKAVSLAAVPNAETGETVGDTSLYEGQADWLKAARVFDGTLKTIAIRGTTFSDVKFNFPKGSDSGH
jgi:hypothetical protein